MAVRKDSAMHMINMCAEEWPEFLEVAPAS